MEFGLCFEDGKWKAYGAGILSSVDELEWAMQDKAEFLPLDCDKIADKYTVFPISKV